jgi:incFII family plasmid replication initiator RepA
MCFHYDPLANRVQRSITNMAIECGLATESASGNLSISRATRALRFMSELGLITYTTEYDPQIGCNIPTDMTFTPALFQALDVSDVAVVAARRSRVEWENKQRKNRNCRSWDGRTDRQILAVCASVSAAIRLSVNLMARSEQPRGGMLHASVRTSRRAFVSS